MSGEVKFRLGRLYVTSVATIGHPRWGLRFLRPSLHCGIFMELDVPWTLYEFRLHGPWDWDYQRWRL